MTKGSTGGIEVYLHSCWRYLYDTYLAFNDVLERLSIAAARVDNQLRVLLNKRVIKRVVVGGDNDAIHPGEQLRINFH